MTRTPDSLYDPKSPLRGLYKIGLSEQRFPLKTRHEIPSISELWRKSKQMTWDAVEDIPYRDFDSSKYSQEQLDAARLGWSRRAWTEYTGIIESPAMLIRLSLDGQAPIEAKFVLAAKVLEEARHCEASFLLAEAMGGYVPEPPPGDAIIKMVVAGFRDRLAFNPEVSPEAAIAGWHIISEGIAVDIFAARYRSCSEPVTKEVLRLILQDEVRHVAVGWDYLEHRIPRMTKTEVQGVEDVVLDIMKNVEMKGFHSMCLLPANLESALREAEAIAAAAGLGFCAAEEEHRVFVKSVQNIRMRFAKMGITIPLYPELEEAA
ncbi:MAG: ferritin-like domain-containing protein [Betaproteobacteria bacterium]|nr:ferritin-like domain-containing protein [Betaproteobacteria bacterium]